MKLPLLVVALAGLGLAADAPKSGAVKDSLEGTWKLVAVEINAHALPMDNLNEARLVVRGEKYSFTLGETPLEMTHRLDPVKKTLDMTIMAGENKGKTYHAIYQLTGDILKICRHIEPEQPRPTEFGTRPDSGLMVVVWERIKT
jgi:uncharacterized protein (TIGR03067 family)